MQALLFLVDENVTLVQQRPETYGYTRTYACVLATALARATLYVRSTLCDAFLKTLYPVEEPY